MNRREHLIALGGLLAAAALPARAGGLPEAAESSELIYVTPISSDGRESRCQAEVWFVAENGGLYVVTATETWRARAVQAGLDRARIWVGNVGVWSSDARYKTLPMVSARAALVTDPGRHGEVLARFGQKYSREWGTWGPRFRDGLAEGSRVMIEYRVG